MPSRHAAACGISIGLLTGIAIAMCLNLDVVDAAYRITVLAACGAWMGILLASLNDLLSSPQSRNSGH
jgi:hypothetical protein